MPLKAVLGGLSWAWLPIGVAAVPAVDAPKSSTPGIAPGDIAAWGLGLAVVLGVFFLCVWGLRQIGGFAAGGGDKIRLIGGLTLGMRERVVLLQVGNKQLVLGVTPGRIETLLVLEGEDCLRRDGAETTAGGFGQKLAQAMKGRVDA